MKAHIHVLYIMHNKKLKFRVSTRGPVWQTSEARYRARPIVWVALI